MTVKGSAWEDFARRRARRVAPRPRAARSATSIVGFRCARRRDAMTRDHRATAAPGDDRARAPRAAARRRARARPRPATRSSPRGGSALDAVVAAVRVLEDDPEFNAGTGSALTRDGTVETDASVMDGATQRVGAVAAVPDLGYAIALARAVLDAGEHVILAGPAAWRFARRGRHRAGAAGLAGHRARARRGCARGIASSARRHRRRGRARSRRPVRRGDLDRRHRRQAQRARRRLADPRRRHVGRCARARSRRPATARRSCASRCRAAIAARVAAGTPLRDAAIAALARARARSPAAAPA